MFVFIKYCCWYIFNTLYPKYNDKSTYVITQCYKCCDGICICKHMNNHWYLLIAKHEYHSFPPNIYRKPLMKGQLILLKNPNDILIAWGILRSKIVSVNKARLQNIVKLPCIKYKYFHISHKEVSFYTYDINFRFLSYLSFYDRF